MTAADDTRQCVLRAGRAQLTEEKRFYLDQGQVHALLAIAEALQNLADEVALVTIREE